MPMISSRLSLVILSLVVSGCAGGLSFDDINQETNNLLAEIGSAPDTDPSTLPTTGSATYRGYLVAATDNTGVGLNGETALTANFVTDIVSGNITNIIDNSDYEYDGSLAVTAGAIDRTVDPTTTWTFSANVNGTISDDSYDYDVNGILDGGFVGTSHQYIGGVLTGTIDDGAGFFDTLTGAVVGKR